MVVPDIGTEQPLQVRFVKGNHVIQQLAAAASDPALGDAVLPRAADHRSDSPDVHGANGGGNFVAVLGVVVEDEKFDWRLVRKGFSQLLHDPDARRVTRDVEMENTPPIMTDDKEDVKHVEGDGRNGFERERHREPSRAGTLVNLRVSWKVLNELPD